MAHVLLQQLALVTYFVEPNLEGFYIYPKSHITVAQVGKQQVKSLTIVLSKANKF